MTERDWLDEIEDNSRISEARSWSIRYTDILRLITEVRRLRWFEENFRHTNCDSGSNYCQVSCEFCDMPANMRHAPDCEYVKHIAR